MIKDLINICIAWWWHRQHDTQPAAQNSTASAVPHILMKAIMDDYEREFPSRDPDFTWTVHEDWVTQETVYEYTFSDGSTHTVRRANK